MTRIQRPPRMREVAAKYGIEGDRLGELVDIAAKYPEVEYRPWDKLRRRTPPEGLNAEEWWYVQKLARQGMYKPLPLLSSDGVPFRYVVADPIHERLHEIDRSIGPGPADPKESLADDPGDRHFVSSLIEEAITSSQLEGASTTRRVASDMLRTGRTPRNVHERMIVNNFATMTYITELSGSTISPETVLDIHARVTQDTLEFDDDYGRLRNPDEPIMVRDSMEGTIVHRPPPAEQLPERLEAMCAFANGESPGSFVHPVIRAIAIHFWLAYDHPFVDGNGRTARALFYWTLLHHGYPLFEYISISQVILRSKTKYANAFIYTETDDNDLTYFLVQQLDVIHQAIGNLKTYIQKKSDEVAKLQEQLGAADALNLRQQALLAHALRYPGFRYSLKSHQRSHNVVYETSRRDLFDLVDRELLDRGKQGKAYYFRAPENLAERIARFREKSQQP